MFNIIIITGSFIINIIIKSMGSEKILILL